mmetsp:Transcript_46854/g.118559  ORF Transcript_46854/g.118559 Transcript_46854/m.118559 type:complete len:106 (+) Transcript_46854:497-814(+)
MLLMLAHMCTAWPSPAYWLPCFHAHRSAVIHAWSAADARLTLRTPASVLTASNMAHEVKPSPFAQWNVESEEVYHQIHSRKKHGEATQSAGQYKVGGTGGVDPPR